MTELELEPIWVTKEAVMAIHLRQIAEHGGGEGVRDMNLLESALGRAKNLYCYGNPPPSKAAMAAAYAYGIAKNHPFIDGNKRTAYVACRLFLCLNGLDIKASKEYKYLAFLKLAAGETGEAELAVWLEKNLVTNLAVSQ